ncbi:FhaA domain-containing protein [Acanthopleuribacter pedis]|uniref:DUF3662 domain-containing protein n=1 Tax=Acanthopleuribacter pedis TaxID=442870 RepID=A0A8J7U117_9BACT|nr:DUF3662 domain-containing protein [Acanthopleuribacter pedis]
MFARFSKKPITIKELSEQVVRQVKRNAQTLMHRQVYYRYIEVFLSEADFEYWLPFRDQLIEQLKQELSRQIMNKDEPYQPVLDIFRAENNKTHISGGF